MTRRIAVPILLIATLVALPAWADNTSTVPAVNGHSVLIQGGGFASTSLFQADADSYVVPLTGHAGLFGLGAAYRLDAGLQSGFGGSYMAGVGAALGVLPGQLGSTYSVRLGAGWLTDGFTVNPTSRLGLAETPQLPSDLNLNFTYSASITPSLSLTGSAEARRGLGLSAVDPLGSANEFVVGAGIGLRF